jgi:hypothetical protein
MQPIPSAVVASLALGFGWLPGLLVGATVASTDAARSTLPATTTARCPCPTAFSRIFGSAVSSVELRRW